jgi:hypothetical protein
MELGQKHDAVMSPYNEDFLPLECSKMTINMRKEKDWNHILNFGS